VKERMSDGEKEGSMEQIRSHKDLRVYQKSFDLAMSMFKISKCFPAEEKYSLTDQIRRSSRSVSANTCPVK
jgi:ornithine carbamoyltransferase